LVKQQVAVPVMRNARMFQKWPVTCDPPLYLAALDRYLAALPAMSLTPRSLHCQGFGAARPREQKEKLESRKHVYVRPVSVPLSLSPEDEAARDVALSGWELLIPAITKTPCS